MTQTISQVKAQALAQAYCSNGFCKAKALEVIGYPKKTSKTTNAGRIFDKPIVKAEIEKIMARNAEICDVEVSEIVQGLREIAFPEPDVHVNNSDRNRALELLGKFKSMFSERFIFGEDQQSRELDENQKIEAEVLAELRLQYGDKIRKEIEKRNVK